MKQTRLNGLHYWGEFQADRRIDFNGFFWRRPYGNVLIDPMGASAVARAVVTDAGGARWILLTNADHWRSTDDWRELTGAEIAAPAAERARFGPAAERVSHWFDDKHSLPAELAEDVVPTLIHGGKSEAEAAFRLAPIEALVFGDVVRSHISGELRLLPDEKLTDLDEVRRTLPRDLIKPLNALLLGDGDCLFRGAHETYTQFLSALDVATSS